MQHSTLLLLVMIVFESEGRYLKLYIPVYIEGIMGDWNPGRVFQ